jgi:hypothetical protein
MDPLTFQVSLDQEFNKIYELPPICHFRKLKRHICWLLKENAGNLYLIDDFGTYHPIDTKEAFINGKFSIGKGVKFFFDASTEGTESAARTKFDTRNIKTIDEDTQKNKKTRNYLKRKKVERTILKKKIDSLQNKISQNVFDNENNEKINNDEIITKTEKCPPLCDCDKCNEICSLEDELRYYKDQFALKAHEHKTRIKTAKGGAKRSGIEEELTLKAHADKTRRKTAKGRAKRSGIEEVLAFYNIVIRKY